MRIEQMNGDIQEVPDAKLLLDEAETVDNTGRQIRLLADQLETQISAGCRPGSRIDLITGLADSITDIQTAIVMLFGDDESVDRDVYGTVWEALMAAHESLNDLAEVLS